MNSLSVDLMSLSHLNSNIRWQQSRMHWLKDGDANTKFFHDILAARRRGNSIVKLDDNGSEVQGVENIRGVVFNHFKNHFRSVMVDRLGAENLNFNMIGMFETSELVKPFSLEEVKQVVWDCDTFKSPWPDGINLGFLTEFWQEVKDDLMRFFGEFHRKGRLSRGLNNTFIGLIPKVESPQKLSDFWSISLVVVFIKFWRRF